MLESHLITSQDLGQETTTFCMQACPQPPVGNLDHNTTLQQGASPNSSSVPAWSAACLQHHSCPDNITELSTYCPCLADGNQLPASQPVQPSMQQQLLLAEPGQSSQPHEALGLAVPQQVQQQVQQCPQAVQPTPLQGGTDQSTVKPEHKVDIPSFQQLQTNTHSLQQLLNSLTGSCANGSSPQGRTAAQEEGNSRFKGLRQQKKQAVCVTYKRASTHKLWACSCSDCICPYALRLKVVQRRLCDMQVRCCAHCRYCLSCNTHSTIALAPTLAYTHLTLSVCCLRRMLTCFLSFAVLS